MKIINDICWMLSKPCIYFWKIITFRADGVHMGLVLVAWALWAKLNRNMWHNCSKWQKTSQNVDIHTLELKWASPCCGYVDADNDIEADYILVLRKITSVTPLQVDLQTAFANRNAEILNSMIFSRLYFLYSLMCWICTCRGVEKNSNYFELKAIL